MATDIVLLEGVRIGFGAFGGSLKELSATDLGVIAAQGALERAKVEPAWIDHTIFGNVVQTSADAIYLARHVGLKSGVPIDKPAVTLNRLCGSGQEAIVMGARLLLTGEADFVLTGGTESMSQAPHVVRGARWGFGFGANTPLEDMLWTALIDSYTGCRWRSRRRISRNSTTSRAKSRIVSPCAISNSRKRRGTKDA